VEHIQINMCSRPLVKEKGDILELIKSNYFKSDQHWPSIFVKYKRNGDTSKLRCLDDNAIL